MSIIRRFWLGMPLLARKMVVAFGLGFSGVFLPAALNTLDRVASGAPTSWSTSAVLALVAGAVATGLRAALALSPINLFPSDRLHTIGAKPQGVPVPIDITVNGATAVTTTGFWSGSGVRVASTIYEHVVNELEHKRPAKTGIHVQHLPERQVHARRRLGRHVEHDERSRSFRVGDSKPPTSPVLWPRHGKPFNQGDLGSCTGNALAGLLNTDPFRIARKGRLLTEKDAVRLYELATTLDSVGGQYPPDDTGSSGLAVCKAGVKLGYLGGYRHAFTLDEALAALKVGPVITGVSWYDSFDQPDSNGLVTVTPGAVVRGGHEVEVCGYDPGHRDPLDGLVAFWQSWGPKWGVSGRFFMTARTWGDLLDRDGDVTVPLPPGTPA